MVRGDRFLDLILENKPKHVSKTTAMCAILSLFRKTDEYRDTLASKPPMDTGIEASLRNIRLEELRFRVSTLCTTLGVDVSFEYDNVCVIIGNTTIEVPHENYIN